MKELFSELFYVLTNIALSGFIFPSSSLHSNILSWNMWHYLENSRIYMTAATSNWRTNITWLVWLICLKVYYTLWAIYGRNLMKQIKTYSYGHWHPISQPIQVRRRKTNSKATYPYGILHMDCPVGWWRAAEYTDCISAKG